MYRCVERGNGGEWRNGREGKGWEKREAKRRDGEGGERVKREQCFNQPVHKQRD